jgi:hypothetical protein
VQALLAGRRLPGRLPDLRRVVLLSVERLPDALLRVQLPSGLRESVVPLLHAAPHPVRDDALDRDPVPVRLVMPVLALVSLSLLVGLSTAASP